MYSAMIKKSAIMHPGAPMRYFADRHIAKDELVSYHYRTIVSKKESKVSNISFCDKLLMSVTLQEFRNSVIHI